MSVDSGRGAVVIGARIIGGAIALVSSVVIGRAMWRSAEREGRFNFNTFGGSYAFWGFLILAGVILLAALDLKKVAGIAGLALVAAGIAIAMYVNRTFHDPSNHFLCGKRSIWTGLNFMLPVFLAPVTSIVLGLVVVIVAYGGQRFNRVIGIVAAVVGLAIVWIVWQSTFHTWFGAGSTPCGM